MEFTQFLTGTCTEMSVR